MTSPETAPERRVGEAEVFVPRMPSSVVQDEINYCAHKLDRTFRDEVDLRTYLYICQDWRDLRAANARLTAEVERLRACLEQQALQFDKLGHPVLADVARLQSAWSPAHALPTPAPEAKE